MSLTHRTVKGIGWSSGSQVIYVLFQFVISAILARLLTPADFGLQAMVLVFTNVILLFRDLGLNAAIIQRKDLTEEHISSSFWLYLMMGILLTVGLSVSAPAIAAFYHEPRLVSMTICLSSTFFIASFSLVQYALFSKRMEFKLLAFQSVSSFVVAGFVGITLAYLGLEFGALCGSRSLQAS